MYYFFLRTLNMEITLHVLMTEGYLVFRVCAKDEK
jgi:hypothetical protein